MKPQADWIIYDNNPILRASCHEVKLPLNLHQLEIIEKMTTYIDTCYQKKEDQYQIRAGYALAANQLGLNSQIIYVHLNAPDEHKYLLANPKIIAASMQKVFISDGEGCLSVEVDKKGYVPRKEKVIVKAYDLINNKEIIINADGLLSICLQHEIDHLHGILYYDHINKDDPFYVNPEWIKY